MKCTRHRVFLAVLICAAKYLNDSSPKNMHWQKYGRFFSLAEVNLMEKQLLYLLDYNLRVEERDLITHLRPFWEPTIADRRSRVVPAALAVPRPVPTPLESPPLTPVRLQVNIPSTSKSTYVMPETGLPTPADESTMRSQQSSTPAAWSSRRSTLYDTPLSASPRKRPSPFSMASLHLEAPTPGLARRDSCDSQSSVDSAPEGTYSGLLVSHSSGQLRVSVPGLPRKASYTARPGTDSILIVDHNEVPSLGSSVTSPSTTSFLKKLVVRNSTSLRSVRKVVKV